MKLTSTLGMVFVAGATMLAGCAEQPSTQSQYPSQQYPSQQYPSQRYSSQDSSSQSAYVGTVDRIELVGKTASNNIAGTLIGGIVGGLIGHQVGGGKGQTAATIVGAAGGAYAGHQIEQRGRKDNETFRVTVRLDNGAYQTITEDNITELQTGDRVRIDGNKITRYDD